MNEQFPEPFSDGGFGGGFGGFGGMAGGLGGIAGGIFQMMMGNPADAAMGYYNKIPGMLNSIYSPYMKAGMNAVNPYLAGGQFAGSALTDQIGKLLSNPSGFMNQMGSNFKQSPGYAFQTQQAQQAVNNAAAAGGMAGSPLQQQNSASVVNNLANQDYYNYLNHAIGLYNTGFNGAQNMYDTGANIANNMYSVGGNMANNYGQNLAETYMNQGNLSYLGQENQNQNMGGGIGSIIAGAASFL